MFFSHMATRPPPRSTRGTFRLQRAAITDTRFSPILDELVSTARRQHVKFLSMSAVGNPYDNAKAESFFKTLKQEEVYLKEYDSFADAENTLTVFIF